MSLTNAQRQARYRRGRQLAVELALNSQLPLVVPPALFERAAVHPAFRDACRDGRIVKSRMIPLEKRK